MAKKSVSKADYKKMSPAQKKAYFEKNVKPNMLEGGVGGAKAAAARVLKSAASKSRTNTAAPIKAEMRQVPKAAPAAKATSSERKAERAAAEARKTWKSYEPATGARRSEGAKKAAETKRARQEQRVKNAEARGMAKGAAITSAPFLLTGATKKSNKKK